MNIKRGVRFLIVGLIAGLAALWLGAVGSPEVRTAATYVWLAAVVCILAGLACAVVSAWRWSRVHARGGVEVGGKQVVAPFELRAAGCVCLDGVMTKTAASQVATLFPEIAEINTKCEAHEAVRPIPHQEGWDEWVASSIEISKEARQAWKATKGLICQKCGGNGHWFASNNRPVQCQCGDGWTAKGRKLYTQKEGK